MINIKAYNVIFYFFSIIFVFILIVPTHVLAAESVNSASGITGFFSQVMSYLHSIADFFLVDLPAAIENFFVYIVAWLLKMKLEGILWSINFSMQIASKFLELVSFAEVVNTLLAGLPNDVRAIASQFAIFEALTMVIEAMLTKFIYGMLN